MINYVLEKALLSLSYSFCPHYKEPLTGLEIPPSRDASLTNKSDILLMHFMLTTWHKS